MRPRHGGHGDVRRHRSDLRRCRRLSCTPATR
jgi:hypothetical protein